MRGSRTVDRPPRRDWRTEFAEQEAKREAAKTVEREAREAAVRAQALRDRWEPEEPYPDTSWVFVYGSLRSGLRHNDKIVDRTKDSGYLLSRGCTATEGFVMVDSTEGFPYAVRWELMQELASSSIVGEAFLVTAAKLRQLDDLEFPHGYEKRLIDIILECDGTREKAWMYLLGNSDKGTKVIAAIRAAPAQYHQVLGGDWKEYCAAAAEGGTRRRAAIGGAAAESQGSKGRQRKGQGKGKGKGSSETPGRLRPKWDRKRNQIEDRARKAKVPFKSRWDPPYDLPETSQTDIDSAIERKELEDKAKECGVEFVSRWAAGWQQHVDESHKSYPTQQCFGTTQVF